jgi:putative ABC transport system permease protein
VTTALDSPAPSRLQGSDLMRVGSIGLRTRKLRAGLSALGIAIGIAAIVAVLGISDSSQADLVAQLDKLGTNLLEVQAGQTFGGASSSLPTTAEAMVGRIGPVQQVSSVSSVTANVYRNPYIDAGQTGGIGVKAARPDLLAVLAGRLAQGRFLDAATSRYPVTVLGSVAAQRLGITTLVPGSTVLIGGTRYGVAGIMESLPLAPDLDRSVLIGYPQAQAALGATGAATTIYLRPATDQVDAVADVLPRTVNPANPDEVQVSQPSDALQARIAAKRAFSSLFLGLGAVALLVGGVGIANVMVISVLERRGEIGLRRALGATRRHVAGQFLTESVLLGLLGGVCGVALGAAVTALYASSQHFRIVVPLSAVAYGVGAALVIGAVAGFYPALRAAHLSPTDALRSV